MASFIITGGNGKRTLSGNIVVKGAKNIALPMVVSSILFEGGLRIKNVPNIIDVKNIVSIAENFGFEVNRNDNEMKIKAPEKIKHKVNESISGQLRGSIVFSGPILARDGYVTLQSPGGCNLGDRPINFFLEAFEKLGAKIKKGDNEFIISAPDGLHGGEIFSNEMSVTLTETLMIMSVLIDGVVIIRNASHDPEIYHLGKFLIDNGVDIKGIGTSKITIKGNGIIKGEGAVTIPPDRIETGSFLIMGLLLGSDLMINNCDPKEIIIMTEILKRNGIMKGIEIGDDYIYITNEIKDLKINELPPIKIKTHEYPGFPTDLQAIIAVYMSQLNGVSFIFESIFERRFNYLNELRKMGVYFEIMNRREVLIQGPTTRLRGNEVKAVDLRAGFALIITAMMANGKTIIEGAEMIDRGYEDIENRLTGIGAKIMRQ